MPVFLARSQLSRGDLRVSLTNQNGYPQDAAAVRYSVYARDSRPVSGRGLPAIRRSTGEYYAPWQAEVPNGSYRIEWEILEEFGGAPVTRTGFFFVVDPSSYLPSGPVNASAVPAPGQFTFLSGQSLGPGDLPLFLKNSGGFLQSASAVFWSVYDSGGCLIAPRAAAVQSAVGTYHAPWVANVRSGDYEVRWEFQQDPGGPLEGAVMGFSVICPARPHAMLMPYSCPPLCCDGRLSYRAGFPCYVLVPLVPPSVASPIPSSPPPVLVQTVTVQASLAANGDPGDSVSVAHGFGFAAAVYVLRRSGASWVDATGSFSASQNASFTAVTVVNESSSPEEFLIVLEP